MNNKLENNSKTGYEHLTSKDGYYAVSKTNNIDRELNNSDAYNAHLYNIANYYSEYIIAKNNARADKLLCQLRRFAAIHNETKITRSNVRLNGAWTIKYGEAGVCAKFVVSTYFGDVYFDSEITAQNAINAYYDELIWYFNEYEDRL